MSDQFQEKEKHGQYVEEWSFSFADLWERLREFFESFRAKGAELIRTSTFSEPLGVTTAARKRAFSRVPGATQ